jgi:hypothetical protein
VDFTQPRILMRCKKIHGRQVCDHFREKYMLKHRKTGIIFYCQVLGIRYFYRKALRLVAHSRMKAQLR